MTIPVWKKGLGLQKIDQVRIDYEGRWVRKHVASLKNAYQKAPYFEEHVPFLEDLFSGKFEKLVDVNLEIIHYLTVHLGIHSRIMLLSEMEIEERGERLILEICLRTGATQFLAQRPVKKFIEASLFIEAGIKIDFFSPSVPVYPQLWGDFIPNLSAFDLLFNCGPKAGEILQAISKKSFVPNSLLEDNVRSSKY